MITDSFDNISEAIISPDSFYGEKKHSSPDYTPDGLHEANHSLDKFYVALEIAKRIS